MVKVSKHTLLFYCLSVLTFSHRLCGKAGWKREGHLFVCELFWLHWILEHPKPWNSNTVSFSPRAVMARWDHLRASLSRAKSTAAALFWSVHDINVGFESQVGGLWMCMWGKRRVTADIYKSCNQDKRRCSSIQISLIRRPPGPGVSARVWGGSCKTAKLRRAGKCDVPLLWLGTASWNHKTVGNLCDSTMSAGLRSDGRCLHSVRPNRRPRCCLYLKADLIEWEERSKASFAFSVPLSQPAWIMPVIPFYPNKGETVLSEGLHESQGHDTTEGFEWDPSDFSKFARRSFDGQLLQHRT